MARSFTREEFYRLVWSKPMTHLAKEFMLSDVALHKICKKHNIPNPPLGWWAKKAAGQKVRQTPLPKAKSSSSASIMIASGNLTSESETLAAVREQARILASEASASPQLGHPIVERTLAALRKAKVSDRGIVSTSAPTMIRCEVSIASIERLAVVLPQIVQAASVQGFRLVAGKRDAEFDYGAEALSFSIAEVVKRTKHALTETEQARLEAWEKKQERGYQGRVWQSLFLDRPKFPDWDYHPTGQLAFELEHSYLAGAPRRAFRDATIQRLENMAGEIAVGLAVYAAAKAEDRKARQAQQVRTQEAALQRELAARAKHIEDRRLATLGAILTEIKRIDEIRHLLTTLDSEDFGGATPRLASFLEWTREYLANKEGALSPHALETRFVNIRLFGDDDDHDYRSNN